MDKISRKILKYMTETSDNPIDTFYEWDNSLSDIDKIAKAIKESPSVTIAAIRSLIESEYIQNHTDQNGFDMYFSLGYKGLTFKEETKSKRKELFQAYLLGIVTTVVAELIIKAIARFL